MFILIFFFLQLLGQDLYLYPAKKGWIRILQIRLNYNRIRIRHPGSRSAKLVKFRLNLKTWFRPVLFIMGVNSWKELLPGWLTEHQEGSGKLYIAYEKLNGLKGQCHEIFGIFLFHESKPSGPLINRLKWFCFKVRFRGEIREKFDSAQC